MRPLFVLVNCLALVLSISAQAKNNGGGPKSPPTKAAESKIKGKPVTEQKASKKSGNTGKGPNSNPNSTGAGATRGPNDNPDSAGAGNGNGPKLTPDKTGVKNISR